MSDLRTRIKEHLTQKGHYDPLVDDDMIDELIDTSALARKIFKDLKAEGPVMYYTTISGSRLSKLNPLLNAYQMMQRNVYQLSTKLGINRNDRLKLKIIELKEQDEFEKLLNEDKE